MSPGIAAGLHGHAPTEERTQVTEPTTVLSELTLGESPRWHEGRLWVCEWIPGRVLSVPEPGRSEVELEVGTMPVTIDWLPDGRLLAVAGGTGQLLRREHDGTVSVHADLSALLPHPWNEVVVDTQGRAYVNSIGFDMMGGAEPTAGIVALVTADGAVQQVADDVWFPNGMALTGDGSTLLVAESHANRLTAFTVQSDGGLGERRVWADLGDGAPDGICLDAEGAAWYADVPNRRCVRVREGGEVLDLIETEQGCFSCALGGPDGRTLFMVTAAWGGPAAVADGGPSGKVVAGRVAVPAANAGVGEPGPR
jgi:sugar lactone lactonase YvrE